MGGAPDFCLMINSTLARRWIHEGAAGSKLVGMRSCTRQGEQEAFSVGETGGPKPCQGCCTGKELGTRLAVGPGWTVWGRFQLHVVKHSDDRSFW